MMNVLSYTHMRSHVTNNGKVNLETWYAENVRTQVVNVATKLSEAFGGSRNYRGNVEVRKMYQNTSY
jgi:hypothetical protein